MSWRLESRPVRPALMRLVYHWINVSRIFWRCSSGIWKKLAEAWLEMKLVLNLQGRDSRNGAGEGSGRMSRLEGGEVILCDLVGFGNVDEWESLPAVQAVVPGVLDHTFFGGLGIWSDSNGPYERSEVLSVVGIAKDWSDHGLFSSWFKSWIGVMLLVSQSAVVFNHGPGWIT